MLILSKTSNLGIYIIYAEVAQGTITLPRSVKQVSRLHIYTSMRKWLRGRASPCQGEGRGFESRLQLQSKSRLTTAFLFAR